MALKNVVRCGTDTLSALLEVYAESKKNQSSHELQEAYKTPLDEAAITAPIEKEEPEGPIYKGGSPKSDSGNNLTGHSATCWASRGGFAELAFGDRPTDFGFRHNSGAAIEA
jgi:hypothetical protein